MDDISTILKMHRLAAGLSLASMASLLEAQGVKRSRAQVYNYENACQTIPREVLTAYVAALDLDIRAAKELYEAAGLIVLVSA